MSRPGAARRDLAERPGRSPDSDVPSITSEPWEPPEGHEDFLDQVQGRVVHELSTSPLESFASPVKRARHIRGEVLRQFEACRRERGLDFPGRSCEVLVQRIVDEMLGLGPLEPLLRIPGVTGIEVDGPLAVRIYRGADGDETSLHFLNAEHLLAIIRRILEPQGVTLDAGRPRAEVALPDGSLVCATMPPYSLEPTLHIRLPKPK